MLLSRSKEKWLDIGFAITAPILNIIRFARFVKCNDVC